MRPDQEAPSLVIKSELAPKINFACHQNSFAILKELSLENNHKTETFRDITITVESNPPFLKPKTWHIDRLAPKEITALTDRDLQLDGNFLLTLCDSMRSTVTFQATIANPGESKHVDNTTASNSPATSTPATIATHPLATDTTSVELLSYNEWGGSAYMPELLAAFVTPNDPTIDRILHQAAALLRQAGKHDAIDGYQSGKRERVWELASAIYSAIANLNLAYCEPPSSFENNGQKIRLPHQIMEGKIATCLDTAALFASAFEQAGLNPIIALPQEHALVGVWLQPTTLPSVIDDAEALRKRIQLNELILLETTFATAHPTPPFSKAIDAANNTLKEEHDATFTTAVDIKRARMHRILPLGLKPSSPSSAPNATQTEESPTSQLVLEAAPALPDFDKEEESETLPETPQGRLERWQRKLLDLTLRNPLLNFKAEKTSLKLLCPSPGQLEDKLAAGEKISIQCVPQLSSQKQDAALHRQRLGESILEEYAREALEKKQLLVDLTEAELSKRSVELYRKAQTSLQEGGANTLYLAFGFLLWKKEDKGDQKLRAPLILVPVALERQSVRSGIKLVSYDDEPRFNTTLLEMLRRDYEIDISNLAGELPTDESGIDIHAIWNIVRKKIKDSPGFEVTEDVVLGHFSFAKYLMWKDLADRTAELKQNPVVRHLLDTPREPYLSDVEFVDKAQLDKQFAPKDLLTPLAGDSSQIAAIATADRGKDFVIIGPPGTGKSQTISNLIAHLIATDKTVLFVSEKTAALEVVYRRLDDIGLGRFCLELHSNKAKKSDVLDKLRKSWEAASTNSAESWQEKAEKLQRIQERLNAVVERLHQKYPNGLTPHFAMGVKVKNDLLQDRIKLSWPSSKSHTADNLNALKDVSQKLAIQAKVVGNFTNTPLALVANGDWSPAWESQIVEHATALANAAKYSQRMLTDFLETIKFELKDHSLNRLEAMGEFAEVLRDSFKNETFYALEYDGNELVDKLEDAVKLLKAYTQAQSKLSCVYDAMAWKNLNIESLEERWQKSQQSWWLKRTIENWQISKELKAQCKSGKPNPAIDIAVLKEQKASGATIDDLDRQLAKLKVWKLHTTDSQALEKLGNLAKKARGAVNKLADNVDEVMAFKAKLQTLLKEGNDLLATDAAVGRAAKAFLDAFDSFQQRRSEFETLTGGKTSDTLKDSKNALDTVNTLTKDLIDKRDELRQWCSWLKRRNQAVDLDLMPLVRGIECGQIAADEIEETFETAYCSWWSGAVISEDELLRTFSSAEHINDILEFRKLDSEFQKLTAQYIAAKLSGKLIDASMVKKNSQWGILQRELQKKTRHKPIRTLAQEIPEVLTKLAPCTMMSPLSVAQYLPSNQALFDVVIFDEASQITVWDAVGSIARGKQVIIAGDPKQMPPTNFFARNDSNNDGSTDDEADLESILDEMLGAGLPSHTLNLHYRSRRESLIAFSNAKYYDNSLVTFPAPINPDCGVKLMRPEGFYARGGARHNEGEAKAIVAEITRRLTDKDEAVRKQSIGVVTFNSEQQSLIENLLDDARSRNPNIEWAFSRDHVLEPVFVKNLESVQGDERDVIMFSVTYGPDQSGYMTMNFGPLNRTGGERRLNVALTRARSEMVVFSTLQADKIDLTRTQAKAVADLKHFLQYAERGPATLGSFVQGSKGDYESPLEVAIARALKEKGWQVHAQVGVSAYRIDLGIVHPDKPGVYLAGIECDGAMYHSSAYARERDKIRQGVLEGLGWKLLRVWSTDWWTNKGKAVSVLNGELERLLSKEKIETITIKNA